MLGYYQYYWEALTNLRYLILFVYHEWIRGFISEYAYLLYL